MPHFTHFAFQRPKTAVVFALLSTWLAVFAAPAAASVEITVAPLRAVLTPSAREATIRVSNPSNRIIELRIGWVDLTAVDQGYEPATPEARAKLSAAPYLSVSPAFMRLQPGASENVVIMLGQQKVKNGAEHRSHLLFSTAAARTPLRKAGGGLEADIGLGVSIPVHVRAQSGANDKRLGKTRAKFAETQLARNEDGDLVVETRIKRDGPYSVYGRLRAVFETPDGERETLGALDNVAVHLENASRLFRFSLGTDELPEGVLTLSYEGRGEYEGRLFTEKSFAISAPE